jgi:hypothetical protein
LLNYYFIKFCTIKNRNNEKKNFKISTVNEGSYPFVVPAGAKLPNPKPNARWRDGFSLVPSIPVGCADNAEGEISNIQRPMSNIQVVRVLGVSTYIRH